MRHYIVKDYEPVIRWFYQSEKPEFFTSYHKRAGTVEECVQDALNSISPEAEFYVVENTHCMAGFFVKTVYEGVAVLEGFHILPPFRDALFLCNFWETVRTVFNQDIHVGILSRNEPAIKHLVRNGFEILKEWEYDNKTFTLLTNKLSDTCH